MADPADRPQVIRSLVAAFAADPVVRHLFPDDATYPRYAAAFFGHLFDKRVPHGTVWTVGRGAAVAMWDAPAGPTPAARTAPAGTVPAGTVLDALPADARARLDAYDAAIHAALPTTPHWYLGVLGTHPEHAGRRLGRAVMAAGLRRAAADGLPAYLETSNPANVEIYRRAGWTVERAVTAGPVTAWIMRWPVSG